MIEGRKPKLPKRLPLDFAKLVAERRANRVAEYRSLVGNHDHQYDIQKAVELENQFNERHRMADALRLGGLPASVSHPVAVEVVRSRRSRTPSRADNAGERAQLELLIEPTQPQPPGAPPLTQAEMNVRMVHRRALADPASLESGNEKMRQRKITNDARNANL
jgi:hypothetical protein